MLYLKWLKQRFIFARRLLVELYNRVFYEKKSQYILHKFNAHRCPHESMLFYSLIGRGSFAIRELIALMSNDKIFQKSIKIDALDGSIDYKKLYMKGSNNLLCPKSPMVNIQKTSIDDSYYEKIANSFFLAYKHDNDDKDISNEWDRISKEFRSIFFDENNKIIKENLENFRGDAKIYSKIFGLNNCVVDTFSSQWLMICHRQ